MKKKLFIFGTLLFMATFIGFNININSEEGDGFALLLANVEAIASSSEGGDQRVKHPTHGGKQYIKGSSYITYERLGVADNCLKWPEFKPLGSSNGYCYSYE